MQASRMVRIFPEDVVERRSATRWLLTLFCIAGFLLPGVGKAHDPGHPHADWYRSQTMNESARKRLGVTYKSCCDAGDHYRTRFRVAGDNSDQWLYLAKDGQWKVVPPDIIKQQDTPEDQPVLFINQRTGVELCFFVPKGGI